MGEKRRRIIPLEHVKADAQHLTRTCFYCYDPQQVEKKVKAVVAVEVEVSPLTGSLFLGICGNHAEVSKLSAEWQESKTL